MDKGPSARPGYAHVNTPHQVGSLGVGLPPKVDNPDEIKMIDALTDSEAEDGDDEEPRCEGDGGSGKACSSARPAQAGVNAPNPDEIKMDDMDTDSDASEEEHIVHPRFDHGRTLPQPTDSRPRTEENSATYETIRRRVVEMQKELREAQDAPSDLSNVKTRFLALDKCGDRRQFLQVSRPPHVLHSFCFLPSQALT